MHIILFYLFMQINFTFVSHNFGLRIYKFISLDMILLVFLSLVLALYYLNIYIYQYIFHKIHMDGVRISIIQ